MDSTGQKIEPFNGEENHRKNLSAPLRKALREVIGTKDQDSAQKQKEGGYTFNGDIKTLANSKLSELQGSGGNVGKNLHYPSSFDKAGMIVRDKVFLTAADYETYKTQAKVYFDPKIGADQNAQTALVQKILEHKSGIKDNAGADHTFSDDENRSANLVTMILPTRIGVLNDANGDAIVQDPPIEAMVSTFTYPDFRDDKPSNLHWLSCSNPAATDQKSLIVTGLSDAAKTNILAMMRLNILAVCKEYKTQGIKLPYILNMPGAFIRPFNDDAQNKIKEGK